MGCKIMLFTVQFNKSSQATAVTDPQYILKGIPGEDQDKAFRALGKLTEPALRQTFPAENFMNSVFFASSHT